MDFVLYGAFWIMDSDFNVRVYIGISVVNFDI